MNVSDRDIIALYEKIQGLVATTTTLQDRIAEYNRNIEETTKKTRQDIIAIEQNIRSLEHINNQHLIDDIKTHNDIKNAQDKMQEKFIEIKEPMDEMILTHNKIKAFWWVISIFSGLLAWAISIFVLHVYPALESGH